MPSLSEFLPRIPARRRALAAASAWALAACTGEALAQMSRPQVTLNSVAPFDTHTWQRLVAQGPRPAAYIFATTNCPACTEAFDALFAYIRDSRKMAELVIVLMDVHGVEALAHARFYVGATRMYGFSGPEAEIRRSITAQWPSALPYVVLLGRDGSARQIHGTPPAEVLRQWLS